jgi:hypothetical protein
VGEVLKELPVRKIRVVAEVAVLVVIQTSKDAQEVQVLLL